MLGHWHAQQRNIRSAREKRFLGIIGIGHTSVVAEVQWVVGPPQQLRLKMTNARLAPDAADARDAHAVGGVPAVQRAVAVQAGMVTAVQAVQAVRIDDITPAELAAIGFSEPLLSDAECTGTLVAIAIPGEPAAVSCRIGQRFSIDASMSQASMRYLITPEPPVPCSEPYVAASVVEAAVQAAAAAERAGAAGSDAPATGDAGAGGAAIVPAAPRPHFDAPGPAPFVPPVPPAAADATAPPAAAPAAAAARAGAGSAPAMPAVPGIPLAPAQAAAASAPQDFNQLLQQLMASPAAAAAFAGSAAAGSRAAPAGASSSVPPVSAAAAPWRQLPGDYSLLDGLFRRVTAAELANVDRWDQLVRALSSGPPPHWAMQPPEDVCARAEFVQHRLSEITSAAMMPVPPPVADGWSAVFAAVRSLMRSAPSGGSGGADLSNSFGIRASAHSRAGPGSSSVNSSVVETAGSSVAAFASSVAAAASRVEGDRSGVVASAVRDLPGAQVASAVLGGVQGLGSRLSSLPTDLQILEAADGQFYNPTLSTRLHTLHLSLSAASRNFLVHGAALLRKKVGVDDPVTVLPHRRADSEKALQLLMRGKPLQITERMLMGSGGDSLLAPFSVVPLDYAALQRGKEVLRTLSYASRLFHAPAGSDFFQEAEERIQEWHREGRDMAKAAELLVALLTHLSHEFRQFFDGHVASLVRPHYGSSRFSEPFAQRLIQAYERLPAASVQPQPLSQQQIDAAVGPAVSAAVAAALQNAGVQSGVPVQPGTVVPGLAGRGRGRRGRGRGGAAVASWTPAAPVAPAAPPAVPAPPAQLPAPPAVQLPFIPMPAPPAPPAAFPAAPAPPPRPPRGPPAVNQAGVIGGAPWAGAGDPSTQEMVDFTRLNVDASGRGRCFLFWRTGSCKYGAACRFSHQ